MSRPPQCPAGGGDLRRRVHVARVRAPTRRRPPGCRQTPTGGGTGVRLCRCTALRLGRRDRLPSIAGRPQHPRHGRHRTGHGRGVACRRGDATDRDTAEALRSARPPPRGSPGQARSGAIRSPASLAALRPRFALAHLGAHTQHRLGSAAPRQPRPGRTPRVRRSRAPPAPRRRASRRGRPQRSQRAQCPLGQRQRPGRARLGLARGPARGGPRRLRRRQPRRNPPEGPESRTCPAPKS